MIAILCSLPNKPVATTCNFIFGTVTHLKWIDVIAGKQARLDPARCIRHKASVFDGHSPRLSSWS